MRYFNLLLICLLVSGGLLAQEQKTTKETKKEASARKKAEQAAKTDSLFKMTDSLLAGKQFVLEAKFLRNSKGTRITATTNLNFISVDSVDGVIQIGSAQWAGYNGVGGITEQGKISNWKVDRNDKKKNFYVTWTIQTKYTVLDISMSVNYEGYSSATLNGMKSGSLTFEGNLSPTEKSSMFKGLSR